MPLSPPSTRHRIQKEQVISQEVCCCETQFVWVSAVVQVHSVPWVGCPLPLGLISFVPLIMALRLNPVRLLVADDVGVGKTIETAMIARELLDRGLVGV